MIGFLHGVISFRDDPFIYINVNGVGYRVLCAKGVINQATNKSTPITVFTYTYVKEDALELFGFAHLEDLKLFEKLITIQGIGPKTAIQVFSVGTRDQIVQAIITSDVAFFTTVPRLGRKNAQKIILELKSKFSKGADDLSLLDETPSEVRDALMGMGFSPKEVYSALKNSKLAKNAPLAQQIKMTLKSLGKA